MNILLSRHGNTFGPHDPVVWTGATNDLPLVEKGIAQAETFAEVLLSQKIKPSAIYCSPLQRTSKYASILVQKLNLPFKATVDPRINEVDYGEWTGLTNEQVIARFGEAALKAWDEKSQWPTEGKWGSSESAVTAEVKSFVHDLLIQYESNETVIVITSNGRLRYFLTLVPGEFEKRIQNSSFKVKTGNICKLSVHNGGISISYWNQVPASSYLGSRNLQKV